MTKDKDEKAVVRARMERTGESYAAARAQLAREVGVAARPEDPPKAAGGVLATVAAGSAIKATLGGTSSAWHLILAVNGTKGIAARVTSELGFTYQQEAPPVEAGSPAAATLGQAIGIAVELATSTRAGRLDSGLLLRAAAQVLRTEHVPEAQRFLLTALQQADLEGLCLLAWQEHGPEGDDQPAAEGGGLFSRFSDRARVAIVGAQEEARALDHNYIGTEHLLLGVLREGGGVGFNVLAARGVDLEAMRGQVVELIGRGEEPATGHIPFTPRAKRVLELALTVSIDLQTGYVGTEHLLIAMSEEGDGVAAQILSAAGCTEDVVRTDVLALLAELGKPGDAPSTP